MSNINHQVHFFHLTEIQKETICSFFNEELVEKEESHVLYLSNSDMSDCHHIRKLAYVHSLCLNHLYMSQDRHIYGINHYRQGKVQEIEVTDVQYYKMTDELLDIQYFVGLDMNDPEYNKALAAYMVHYLWQCDSPSIIIKAIHNDVIYLGFKDSEVEFKMIPNVETGEVVIQYQDQEISCPDIRGDNGLEVFEEFIEDQYFDLIESFS